jgi:hypothetical protein
MDPSVAAKFAARAAGTVSVQTYPADPAVSAERSRIEQKLAAHAKAQEQPPPAPASPKAFDAQGRAQKAVEDVEKGLDEIEARSHAKAGHEEPEPKKRDKQGHYR